MVLVTGAGGWLGLKLAKQLLEKGEYVRVLNIDMTNGLKLLKKQYNEKIDVIIGDICDVNLVSSTLENVDKVFHLAAKVHEIPTNLKEEKNFYKINFEASKQLFEQCILHDIKRIIFFSTVSVYKINDNIIDISSLKEPKTIYGKSKLEAEIIANELYKNKKLPITIIEPVTVYGDGDIGNFIKLENLIKKGLCVRFGNGKNKKTIIYYKDLIDIVMKISEDDSTIGDTIICGTQILSLNEINNIYIQKYSKKVLKFYFPMWLSKFILFVCKLINLSINKKIIRNIEALMNNNEFNIKRSKLYLENPMTFKQYILKRSYQHKKVLFTATVDSHILSFHLPYLKYFKDNGYEVHVATNSNKEIKYCDVKHKVSFERNPFKLNNIVAIQHLKRIIEGEKFDIIHCHTPMGSVVTRLAAKKARKTGTKVFYTAHGFHFYKGAPLINWLVYYPIEKHLSRYTDSLITINKEDYELAKNKFKKAKIEYVPGVGIDTKKFDFNMSEIEKEQLRNEIGISKSDFVIIYVAELSKRKHQDMLINVMKILCKSNSNIKLLLAGTDSLNGYYQYLVNENNLADNIKFLGYRKDIPELMKISNLAVSTSKQEGLPVNILEAMAANLPIICTNCRGNRDLIENEVNGYLVNIDNIEGMSSCILSIIKNDSIKNKFVGINKEKIKEYELSNILNEMKKVYELDMQSDKNKEIALIIPNCDDLNRGDQALVLETKNVIKKAFNIDNVYMMSNGDTTQCARYDLRYFFKYIKTSF